MVRSRVVFSPSSSSSLPSDIFLRDRSEKRSGCVQWRCECSSCFADRRWSRKETYRPRKKGIQGNVSGRVVCICLVFAFLSLWVSLIFLCFCLFSLSVSFFFCLSPVHYRKVTRYDS